jgi:hypothetical protein
MNNNNETYIHIQDNWKAIKASLDEKREQMQQKLKSQMEASKKEFEIQTKRLAGKAVAMRHFFLFFNKKKFVEFFFRAAFHTAACVKAARTLHVTAQTANQFFLFYSFNF